MRTELSNRSLERATHEDPQQVAAIVLGGVEVGTHRIDVGVAGIGGGRERVVVQGAPDQRRLAARQAHRAVSDTRRRDASVRAHSLRILRQAGGHAGCDENGYVQAIRPDTVHPELMTDAHIYNITPGIATYPYPGTVLTYKEGEGAPVFDEDKARRYRERAIALVLEFCVTTLEQWKALGV